MSNFNQPMDNVELAQDNDEFESNVENVEFRGRSQTWAGDDRANFLRRKTAMNYMRNDSIDCFDYSIASSSYMDNDSNVMYMCSSIEDNNNADDVGAEVEDNISLNHNQSEEMDWIKLDTANSTRIEGNNNNVNSINNNDSGSKNNNNSHSLISSSVSSSKKTSRRNPWGQETYAELIESAINSYPNTMATLQQIYDYISINYQYFSDRNDSTTSAGWKNSIRHNLSLHDKFIKCPKKNENIKSSLWTVNYKSNYKRARSNSMDCKKVGMEMLNKRKLLKEKKSSITSQSSNILLEMPSHTESSGSPMQASTPLTSQSSNIDTKMDTSVYLPQIPQTLSSSDNPPTSKLLQHPSPSSTTASLNHQSHLQPHDNQYFSINSPNYNNHYNPIQVPESTSSQSITELYRPPNLVSTTTLTNPPSSSCPSILLNKSNNIYTTSTDLNNVNSEISQINNISTTNPNPNDFMYFQTAALEYSKFIADLFINDLE